MTSPLVVVAEDEPDLRDLFRIMLEHDGLRVHTVADGPSVVPACTAERPDLLLLDLTLPGLGGVAVTEALRAEPSLTRLPVLIITGLGRESGVDAAMAAGANDYLIKPFRPAELNRRVALLLGRAAP
jgi:two-component system response regulator MtrA